MVYKIQNRIRGACFSILHTPYSIRARKRGFTLVETLVAVSLLTVAISAPMTLTMQSLSSARYARDQVVAFFLAQEALETIRHIRDGNILNIAFGTSVDMLRGIPAVNGDPFTVDARSDDTMLCSSYSGGVCPVLSLIDGLYGYGSGSVVTPTGFTRFVRITTVSGNSDEYKVEVTVSWLIGARQRSISMSENLYRWVSVGSGQL